ncbi:MAG: DUF1682 domain-containing protein [Spirochaetales bacterium]|jgi:hypothetical protein|nr:DUF1682 domain-containing protein [Spirochaetales bacterium]
MALPADLTKNVPTLEEFWAFYTKAQEEAIRKEAKWQEEAAERQKEAAERQKEAARREAKWQEEAASRKEERERDMKKLEALHAKTERIVARVSKQMGEAHNRFGELAEHLVVPRIASCLNGIGYHFIDLIAENVKIQDTGQNVLTEIDLLLNNGDYSIAVEIKSRPAEQDIAHHVRRLEILREHMDRQNDRRKVRGAIAGVVFPQEVKAAAIAAGLYVLEQTGLTMKLGVEKDFKPREW